MILLDTNYLIGALIEGSDESARILVWLQRGETLSTSAICWYEFLSGPVGDHHIRAMTLALRGGIIPFGEAESQTAATLFNKNKRARRLRIDAMIAATAITHQATLATSNRDDFVLFARDGLKLVSS